MQPCVVAIMATSSLRQIYAYTLHTRRYLQSNSGSSSYSQSGEEDDDDDAEYHTVGDSRNPTEGGSSPPTKPSSNPVNAQTSNLAAASGVHPSGLVPLSVAMQANRVQAAAAAGISSAAKGAFLKQVCIAGPRAAVRSVNFTLPTSLPPKPRTRVASHVPFKPCTFPRAIRYSPIQALDISLQNMTHPAESP